MPLLNHSFEDEGALPGEAAHWTLSAVTRREEIAGFGVAPEQAWEDFERWFELSRDLGAAPTARAFFGVGVDGFDAFAAGWGAGVFRWDLAPAQLVPGAFSAADIEHCESGWSNEPFHLSWEDSPASTALFDGEPREDFEDQWRSNEGYAWSWSSVTASLAMFDGGAQAFEDFENAWAHAGTL